MGLDKLHSGFNVRVPNVIKQVCTQELQKAKQIIQPKQTNETNTRFTLDTTDLEVQAEMNKALGLIKSNQNKDDYYAKIDKEFSKDPIAFAEKYASPEVIEHAQASTTDFDICGTLARTLSPERQAKIVEGFSQRNESPRAFTGEFLDLFTATA